MADSAALPPRLDDYLRLPLRLAPIFTCLEEAKTPGDVDYRDFEALADALTAKATSTLAASIPGAVFHATYVRGSIVSDRIDQSAKKWRHVEALLGLEPELARLRQTHGDGPVDALVEGLQHAFYVRMLNVDGKTGASKALYRIRELDSAVLVPANLGAVEAFVDAASHLSDGLEPGIVAVLRDVEPPGGERILRWQLAQVFKGLGRDDLLSKVEASLPLLLKAHLDAACYSPLVPLTSDCVSSIATALALDEPQALLLLRLFRFAVLTYPLLRDRGFSDFSLRSLSVFPAAWDEAGSSALIARLEGTNAATEAIETDAAVAAFRRAYPNVKLSYRPQALFLPPALVSGYLALDLTQRLDLATRVRIGPEYAEASLPGASKGVALLAFDPEDGWRQLGSLDLTRAKLSSLLDAAVRDSGGEAFLACTEIVGDIVAHDTNEVTRGVWAGV